MNNIKSEKKNSPMEVIDDALEQVVGGSNNDITVIERNLNQNEDIQILEPGLPVGAIMEV